MYNETLINTLYLSQRDISKTYSYSKEVNDLYNKLSVLDEKFREKLAEYPDLLKLYDELDNARDDYDGENEINAYNNGFKSGLQIAVECGLYSKS